jgi:hypothetical protein
VRPRPIVYSVPRLARWLLFLFAALLLCPIRYSGPNPYLDNTWVFALNYAAAHGLAVGRDVLWTSGPLGYLAFPQDIGNNLAHGLIFQSFVWMVLLAILADLFFRGAFKLRNLALFTVFVALSAPLYWFNYFGLENLVLMGALVLLIVERVRGGIARYVIALALIGILPLIKLTGAIAAGGALAGYLADRVIRLRMRAWPSVALAATVPLAVAAFGYWLTLPSWNAFQRYLRASLDFVGNYSIAMSLDGEWVEWILAAEVLILIALALLEVARCSRQIAAFLFALLAIPLLLTLKHGFVREDAHIVNFFCFAGLALGLIALGVQWAGRSLRPIALILLAYAVIVIPVVYALEGAVGIEEMTGVHSAWFTQGALSLESLHTKLRAQSFLSFDPGDRLEPAIRDIIRDSPVASLTPAYSYAAIDRLNLRLYPVVQKYQAYTPYLDGLNAAWVRGQGPRFLIVDWYAIDDRHPWVETPAMWAEIYRWYNTRTFQNKTVLLERRDSPRFERFELVRSFRQPFRGTLQLPDEEGAIFWTMNCRLNRTGNLRKLFFRVDEVDMTVDEVPDETEDFRVIPEVLASPVMGNFLPNSIEDVALLFDPAASPKKLVNSFSFDGPGIGSYHDTCDAAFFRTR